MIYALVADNVAPLLLDFAEKLNSLIQLNGHNKIAKILANSLYGRLGMTESLSMTRLTRGETQEGVEYDHHLLENVVLSKKKPKSNIIIAAIITSRARIKLYEGFQEVLKNNGRLLYTDTDSIIAAFPSSAPVENKPLGQIKFDTNKADTRILDCAFALPKTYALAYENFETIRAKGVNFNDASVDEFKNKFYNEESLKVYRQTLVRTDNLEYHYSKDEIKINLGGYDKRRFNATKTETVPLYVAMY